jgi:hypothetical protein
MRAVDILSGALVPAHDTSAHQERKSLRLWTQIVFEAQEQSAVCVGLVDARQMLGQGAAFAVAPVGKSRRLFRQAEQPNLTLDEIDAAKCKQVITGSRPEEPA